MAVPKKSPSLWRPDATDNAKLKQELADCEKEKRSLSALVVHRRDRYAARQEIDVK
jgi:hypothetical protein